MGCADKAKLIICDQAIDIKRSLLRVVKSTVRQSAPATIWVLQRSPDPRLLDLLSELGVEYRCISSWAEFLAALHMSEPDVALIEISLASDEVVLPATMSSIIQIIPTIPTMDYPGEPLAPWIIGLVRHMVRQAHGQRRQKLIYDRLQQRELAWSTVAMLLRLCANGTPSQAVSQLLMQFGNFFHAEAGMLYYADPQMNTLTCEVMFGDRPDMLYQQFSPINQRIASWAADSGNSVCIADLRTDPRFSQDSLTKVAGYPRSVISLPLVAFGTLRGVLQLNSSLPRVFSNRDLIMLNELGALIALIITAAARADAIAHEAQ